MSLLATAATPQILYVRVLVLCLHIVVLIRPDPPQRVALGCCPDCRRHQCDGRQDDGSHFGLKLFSAPLRIKDRPNVFYKYAYLQLSTGFYDHSDTYTQSGPVLFLLGP